MKHWLRTVAALVLAAAAAMPAWADAGQDSDDTQLLYQQALQSIAEGRKTDASETLMRVIGREPLHAGAWLDLALIQCELGHAAEAERLFDTIEERFAPPAGIAEVIAKSRKEGCHSWQPRSQGAITIGRGIDQNVNQGASVSSYAASSEGVQIELPLLPEFLPQHDQYTLLSADYLRDLTPNGATGYVQFQQRRYDRLGHYNSASLFAGVDQPWRFGRWTVHGDATLGLITLGTGLYQRETQLRVRVGPPLPLPDSLQMTLSAQVTHLDYLTLTNFNSNTTELRSQLNYRSGNSSASASMAFLSDHALAARPGGDRLGWLGTAQWRWSLPHDATAELGYTHQRWHSDSAYAPGFIDQVREQTTQVWRLGLSYPLSRTQALLLDARQVRNKETISIFQYNDRQLQLSWQWQWP